MKYSSAKFGKRNYIKERDVLRLTLDEEVISAFEKYCEENEYCKTRLLVCILEEFLEKYGIKE